MTTGVFPSRTSPFRQKLGQKSHRGGEEGMRGVGQLWGRKSPSLPPCTPHLKSMALSPISIPVRTVASSRSMMAPES